MASSVSVPHPPAAVLARPVVAKMTPPAPPPAFAASGHPAPVVTNSLIRPAIPPPGSSAVALRPARATLPPPRPATAPTASFAGGGKASGAPRATSQPTGVAAPPTGPTTGGAGPATPHPNPNQPPSHAPPAQTAAPQH